jgi:histidyl-tRNA synthetase
MRTAVSKGEQLKLLKKTDDAGRAAIFYGFLPVQSPKITKADLDLTRDLDPLWHPSEKAAILREFSELKGNSTPQPLMLYFERPFAGSSERKKPNRIECELAILGSYRSVCEGILIQAARAVIEGAGWKDITVRLNSVGNKDSVAEFERKMSAYVRRRLPDFPPELRQAIKKDLYYLIHSKDEKYKEWTESAPQSVDYLSELSRIHLKDILEFLETVELPYIMEPALLGDIKYATETVFEIIASTEHGEEVLARGIRWNRLSKKIENRKEVPAISVSISAKILKPQKTATYKQIKPKFFLIQFGPEAKQKSFLVLEKLRRAGVPVTHSLAKDKLTGQIFSAEQGGAPYIILLGQKEALDNVAVIRNATTRAQYTVPIDTLGEFIKKSTDFK